MGRRRLYTSMAVGALLGGVYALFDKDTRNYTKEQLGNLKEKTSYIAQHPTETVHNVRETFNKFNSTFNYQAENAINALEQIETTLDKVTKK
ncbi:YtxH domain-containing protein [Ornithinibacillus halophilus]|uniref:Gas vesicle protein n=1 Tax=Ornithinibacillus halophilus TaxID=930117 RepID=A0A1M5MHI4_9BACI|nr:YtxH domain-containing protein [Ornithinibacillus halophilus]SHG76805.1 hypothetical protein SAMN05216225_105912 [Ornithinibacillus halophilus]